MSQPHRLVIESSCTAPASFFQLHRLVIDSSCTAPANFFSFIDWSSTPPVRPLPAFFQPHRLVIDSSCTAPASLSSLIDWSSAPPVRPLPAFSSLIDWSSTPPVRPLPVFFSFIDWSSTPPVRPCQPFAAPSIGHRLITSIPCEAAGFCGERHGRENHRIFVSSSGTHALELATMFLIHRLVIDSYNLGFIDSSVRRRLPREA